MAKNIKMPKLSDDMQEGTVVKWFKRVGDSVEEGEILLEIETDKANMEVECFYPGILMEIKVKEGETVSIGTVIAIIGESEEEMKAARENKKEAVEEKDETKEIESKFSLPTSVYTEQSGKGESNLKLAKREIPRATPVAIKIAEEHGISLLGIEGTGPEGRIVKEDIERHITEGKPKTLVEVPGKVLPLDQKRRYIVRKMIESKTTIPHYYLNVEVNVDESLKLRETYNQTKSTKISITDFIIKASANALAKYPLVNAHFEEDKIRYNEHINIAIAVDTGEILLAPVIKNCETMTISEISNLSKVVIEKARGKKLKPEDYEGGTFYISNIGGFGIDEITPIVFPSTSAILGVGAIRKKPTVVNDQVRVGQMMKITISADHRVLDGARAAEFLMEIKRNLENPLNLLA
jgi:pyruvate dehydrogenase E2 component (dihydrolipoamide acetyltransferase)